MNCLQRVRQVPLTFILLLGLVPACQSTSPSPSQDYRTIASDPRRDTERAKLLNGQAADLIEQGKWVEAEGLLKDALSADVMFGPAHNNLGLLYYHQKRLYHAAWEFQYAAKLMPHQSEPKNNLGLVFEASGRLSDAIDWYEQARTTEPDNPQLIANAARARVKRGDKDEQVKRLLGDVVLKDPRPQWVTWAREKLALMP